MVFLALVLSGCAHWVQTELFFGLGMPDGSVISAAEWQRFVDAEATPRLPDGFSVLEANGQWRNAAGVLIHEPARLLLVLHPNTRSFDRAIEALRQLYVTRFHQEAVLRADLPSQLR